MGMACTLPMKRGSIEKRVSKCVNRPRNLLWVPHPDCHLGLSIITIYTAHANRETISSNFHSCVVISTVRHLFILIWLTKPNMKT